MVRSYRNKVCDSQTSFHCLYCLNGSKNQKAPALDSDV